MREKYEELIAQGYSQRQIADELERSQTSVRYNLKKWGLKTIHRHRHPKSDEPYMESECIHHGLTTFVREPGEDRFKCKRCRVEGMRRRRINVKQALVDAAGGRCVVCGYSKSLRALQFHHRDREQKEYAISELVQARKLELALKEIQKCDLLCGNCHDEREDQIEDGWRNGSATERHSVG